MRSGPGQWRRRSTATEGLRTPGMARRYRNPTHASRGPTDIPAGWGQSPLRSNGIRPRQVAASAEDDRRFGTLPRLAGQADLPAEAVAQPAHDRQAQAGALRAAGFGAIERL